MCLGQGPQRSDAGEARTRGLSVSSQALNHWATALPVKGININIFQENGNYYEDVMWDSKFEWWRVLAHYVKWIFLLTIHEIEDNKIKNIPTGVMRQKVYS